VTVVHRPAEGGVGLRITVAAQRQVMRREDPSERAAVWIAENIRANAIPPAARVVLDDGGNPAETFVVGTDAADNFLDEFALVGFRTRTIGWLIALLYMRSRVGWAPSFPGGPRGGR